MNGCTVKFIKVANGDRLQLGDTGIVGVSGNHKLVGFKPGRAGRPEGWLVFLVDAAPNAPTKRRGER